MGGHQTFGIRSTRFCIFGDLVNMEAMGGFLGHVQGVTVIKSILTICGSAVRDVSYVIQDY